MHALFDLAGVSCSGRLRRRTPLGVSCLEIAGRMGFGRAHPCFCFQRERDEALLSVFIMEHILQSMLMLEGGE
jgi:hypothetical protein